MRAVPAERRIQAVGIVLPVHNEELLLPRALDALGRATSNLPVGLECRTAVVLDDCTDDSAVIARQWAKDGWTGLVQCHERNVGLARRVGCDALLHSWTHLDPGSIWLASTDSDSQVPPHWLTAQLAAHSAGADLWAGRVAVADWSSHRASTAGRWTTDYEQEVAPIHGANMGLTGSAYLEAGGFRAFVSGEDRELHLDVLATGARAHYDSEVKVVTSARRKARAPLGFAHALNAVEAAAIVDV
jgi:glycosyltransferase involved in cell wall biosynthesis